MDTIFTNSNYSKTSDLSRILLNLTGKINFLKSEYGALSTLSIYYTWKNIKKSYKNNELKTSNYLINLILYQTFKIILSIP